MSKCGAPPGVSNGAVSSVSNTTAGYACQSGFQMSGSPTIACGASNVWSSPPSCIIIEHPNTVYANFAPEWLLILLAVLCSLLVLSCLACLLWYCCCKTMGTSVHPMFEGGQTTICCRSCRRGQDISTYERNNIRHNHTDFSSKHQNGEVITSQTTSIHGTEVFPTDHPDGLFTSRGGLMFVPVKPHEAKGYQANNSKKISTFHGTQTEYNLNSGTPRSNGGSDAGNKTAHKDLPQWMPHARPIRNNNQRTH